VAYRKKGEVDGSTEYALGSAIEDFNTAIQLDPGYVRAYYNRGVTRLHFKE
jgi:lipoprotein NlpI